MDFLKRTWAEIDLDCISHNYKIIQDNVNPGTKILCVVKADGYGHGAGRVAKELAAAGAGWFGVSNIEEALALRHEGIADPILILGYTPPSEAAHLAENHISQTVFSMEYALALSKQAVQAGVTVNMHVKLDTGMTRLGLMFQDPALDRETIARVETIARLEGLYPEGIFTHFAVADDGANDGGYTRRQFDLFMLAVDLLGKRNVSFAIRHCCNSAGIIAHPEMQLDMVRPGIILYGLSPSPQLAGKLDLQPAMSLKTVVSMVKEIRPHTAVSYGRTYASDQASRVATVPIGYADGYPRSVSSKAQMIVDGCFAPVIGRVCMDQLMLDVSGIPHVSPGDVVTVFGQGGDAVLPIEQLAALAGTINYETCCLIGKRVPRIFIKNKNEVGTLNYILP